MKLLIFISILIIIKTSYGLICYSCKEELNANCVANMTDTTGIPIATCQSGDVCLTYRDLTTKSIYLFIYFI